MDVMLTYRSGCPVRTTRKSGANAVASPFDALRLANRRAARGDRSPAAVNGAAADRRRAGRRYLLFFKSRRIASSASMTSSREARLLLKLSFRLNAFDGALKAKT